MPIRSACLALLTLLLVVVLVPPLSSPDCPACLQTWKQSVLTNLLQETLAPGPQRSPSFPSLFVYFPSESMGRQDELAHLRCFLRRGLAPRHPCQRKQASSCKKDGSRNRPHHHACNVDNNCVPLHRDTCKSGPGAPAALNL